MARVAILIDGDNISATHAPRIAALGQAAGRVDLQRAYADATNGSGWAAVPGVRLVHAGTGKNAADLLLAIDAMELALAGDFATLCIASSDRDFTHLAARLREHGKCVIGVGEDKAPHMFRAACTRFETLPGAVPPRPVTAAQSADLPRLVRDVILDNSANGAGLPLAVLGRLVFQQHGIRKDDLAEGDWRACLTRYPEQFCLDPKGKNARIRVRASGFDG